MDWKLTRKKETRFICINFPTFLSIYTTSKNHICCYTYSKGKEKFLWFGSLLLNKSNGMVLYEHGQNRDQSREVTYSRLYNPPPRSHFSICKKDKVVSRRQYIRHHRNIPVSFKSCKWVARQLNKKQVITTDSTIHYTGCTREVQHKPESGQNRKTKLTKALYL
jgi:hypothetical protein